MIRNQRRHAKGEIERYRTIDDRIIFNRADIQHSNVLIHWIGVCSNVNKPKKLFVHFNAYSSSLELLTRQIFALNQYTINHAVSIWYNQVQKMHQGKTGF